MLATHKALVDSFRALSWPVNQNASGPGTAILVGRYPEDTYFGGGAWPLCTLACAEMLYDAIAQFNRGGTLEVDSINLGFFRDLSPDVAVGTYTGDAMNAILANVTTYADGFVKAVQVCVTARGSSFYPSHHLIYPFPLPSNPPIYSSLSTTVSNVLVSFHHNLQCTVVSPQHIH